MQATWSENLNLGSLEIAYYNQYEIPYYDQYIII